MRIYTALFSLFMMVLLLAAVILARLFMAEPDRVEQKYVEVPEEISLPQAVELPESEPELEELPPEITAPALVLSDPLDLGLSFPQVDLTQPLDVEIEVFRPTRAPAELSAPNPQKTVSRPITKSITKPISKSLTSVKKPSQTPSKAPPRRVETEIQSASPVGIGDLDGKPTLVRRGRLVWPRSLRSIRSGVVTLRVELDTKGRVRVLNVISSPHPALSAAAKKFASGCRYTVPRQDGVPVKARFPWPIQIEYR